MSLDVYVVPSRTQKSRAPRVERHEAWHQSGEQGRIAVVEPVHWRCRDVDGWQLQQIRHEAAAKTAHGTKRYEESSIAMKTLQRICAILDCVRPYTKHPILLLFVSLKLAELEN
jgi:hypothetical protein